MDVDDGVDEGAVDLLVRGERAFLELGRGDLAGGDQFRQPDRVVARVFVADCTRVILG